MEVNSHQGVVLSDVGRRVPLAGQRTAIDVLDPVRHHLIWGDTSALQVRTPRHDFVVASPLGMWIPAGHPATVVSSRRWWAARFIADTCPLSWARATTISMEDVVGPILAHLSRHPHSEWATHLLSAAIAHLLDSFVSHAGPLPTPSDPRAREVADMLVADPSSTLELGDWAPRVGASERTLRRLFQDETGVSFRAWRSQLRVHTALRLLSDGLPVGEVARRCGYRSREALDKTFTAQTGITPAQFVRRRVSTESVGGPTETWPPSSRSWPPGSNRSHQSLTDLMSDLTGDEMNGWNRRLTLLGAATMLIAAACGSDDTSDDGSADATTADTTAETSAPDDLETAMSETPDTEPASPGTVVVTDGLGNDVEVPSEPARIAALDLFTATHLLQLGVHPVVTPIPDLEWIGGQENLDAWSAMGFDPDLVDVETLPFGGDFNVEEIATAAPDLIVGQPSFIGESLDSFSDLAPVVLWESGTSPITAQLEAVAGLVGRSDRATELITGFDDRLQAISDSIEVDSIAIIDNNNYDGQFYVYGEGGGITTDWADRLGLRVVAPEVDLDQTGGAYVSTEIVPSLDDADAVVVFSAPLYGDPMLEDALFLTLDAVNGGRVCDAGDYNQAIGVFSLDAYADQLESVAGCLADLAPS